MKKFIYLISSALKLIMPIWLRKLIYLSISSSTKLSRGIYLQCFPYKAQLYFYAHVGIAFEKRKHLAAIKAAGISSSYSVDLSIHKKSDTVFILGSGASINKISRSRWSAISQCDSIGFNFWIAHFHTPTIYMFEYILNKEIASKYIEVMSLQANRYTNTIKLIRNIDRYNSHPEFIHQVKQYWGQDIFALQSVRWLARNNNEMEKNIKWARDNGYFDRQDNIGSVWKDKNGSLLSVIALAVKMGYKKIVLCGIDLVNSNYFYQDDVLYPNIGPKFRSSSNTLLYSQMYKRMWSIPINEAIYAMKKIVLDPYGISIYVESKCSALYPVVPLAPEHIFNHGRL